jgi:hypothetical protein
MGSSGSAQQGPSLEDLLTIERFIDGGDWRALYAYLETKPDLMAGQGPLATELRSFVEDVELGRLDQFDAPTGSRREANLAGGTVNQIY